MNKEKYERSCRIASRTVEQYRRHTRKNMLFTTYFLPKIKNILQHIFYMLQHIKSMLQHIFYMLQHIKNMLQHIFYML